MKYVNFYYISILLSFLLFSVNVFGQCTPDQSYTQPGVYPNTIPDATVGQYYDLTLTLALQKDTTELGVTCTFEEIEILSVSNIPSGLSWVSNKTDNTFYPQTETHGCISVYGTPTTAGLFTVTAKVKAKMGGGSLCPSEETGYEYLTIVVKESSTVNDGFAMTGGLGCAPLSVDLENKLLGAYTYSWDMGDGNAYTTTDAQHVYQDAGTYYVTLTANPTTPSTYYFTGVSIHSVPNKYSPGLEIDPDPDLYYILYDGSNKELYNGADEGDISYDVKNFPLDIQLGTWLETTNQTYKIEVYDYEKYFTGGADDYLGTISFNGNDSTNTKSQSFGNSGTLKVTYEMYVDAPVTKSATDTVYVYPVPDPDPDFSVGGPTEFCRGDTLILASNHESGNLWYKDFAYIPGEENDTLQVYETGWYHVEVENSYGCASISPAIYVVVNDNPPKPTFWYMNDTLYTGLTGYDLQWYLDGVAISGATLDYVPIENEGSYSLVATNEYGCSVASNSAYYTPKPQVGINDIEKNKNLFTLYPNPSADGMVNINFTNAELATYSIEVVDMLGKIVYTKKDKIQGKVNMQYNLSYLESGVYMMQVKNGSIIQSRKLILDK